MMKARYYPVFALLALLPAPASAQQPDSLHVIGEDDYPAPAWGANFGVRFDADVSVGPRSGQVALPRTGCAPLTNPEDVEDEIVFFSDGECSYVTKVKHASAAGALAVVVFPDDREPPDSRVLVLMEGECGVADGCTAPAVFISRSSALAFFDSDPFNPEFAIIPIRVTSPVALEDATPRGRYALAPAYPNPFSSETTIGFTLPAAQRVRFAAYDVLGREVAILADDVRQAGEHTVEFSASSLPQGLSSGVFIVWLEAGQVRLAQRVTLMR